MRNLFICLCLATITFAVYWSVHRFEFVNYDDEGYVYENAHVVKGLTLDNIDYAFTTTEMANYHPLTWLSYELDVSLFGLNAKLYHLENVFICALTVPLLFLFLYRATGDLMPAIFAAALFAVHPAHVESVAWIAERKDVLAGLFFVLALLAYLSYVRASSPINKYLAYGSMLLLIVLGLLAKQILVTFPCVLLLLDYWPLRRTPALAGENPPIRWKSLVIEKIPLLILSLAASITIYLAQKAGGAMIDGVELPVAERAANAALSYARYLGTFFWPRNLSVFYPRIKDLPMESVAFSAAMMVAVTALCFWLRKRAPFLAVGWLVFVGTLVPVIGIVQVGWQSMADRYLYLPMIGLTIMIAWGVKDLLLLLGSAIWMRWLTTAGAVAVLIGASIVTVHQLRYWHDTRILFEHALAVTTENPVANIQLGYLDARLGDVAGARRYYEQAIRIDPTYFVTEFDLANLLLNNHQPELAIPHYQKAAEDRPGVAKVENNWGIALVQLHQPREAFEHFRAAVRSDPDMADAHFNLGQLFLSAGRLDAAADEFQKTLTITPDHAGAQKGLDAIHAARSSATLKM